MDTDIDNAYVWDYWNGYLSYLYGGRPEIFRSYIGPGEYIIKTWKNGTQQYGNISDFNGNVKLNGNKTSQNYTFSTASLFGSVAYNYAMSGKFYYLTAKDSNNNLVIEYVPVIDGNDVVCMYDKVSRTFVYPYTGTPIAGPVKN